VDVEEARAEADAIFEKFVEGRGADLRETELQCERFQQRESLMFLPVYRVRFAYRGRLFEASVDGLEGHVVQARLPVDEAADLLPSLFAAAAGGLFIGAILRTAAMPPELLPELATWPGRAALFAIAAAGSFALRHLLRALAARLAAGGKDLVLNGH
jgi:hypothetical protein